MKQDTHQATTTIFLILSLFIIGITIIYSNNRQALSSRAASSVKSNTLLEQSGISPTKPQTVPTQNPQSTPPPGSSPTPPSSNVCQGGAVSCVGLTPGSTCLHSGLEQGICLQRGVDTEGNLTCDCIGPTSTPAKEPTAIPTPLSCQSIGGVCVSSTSYPGCNGYGQSTRLNGTCLGSTEICCAPGGVIIPPDQLISRLTFSLLMPNVSDLVSNTSVVLKVYKGANVTPIEEIDAVALERVSAGSEYFHTKEEVVLDIKEEGIYTILVKGKNTLMRVFQGVGLTPGSVVSCTGNNEKCGELVSLRDQKPLWGGDSQTIDEVQSTSFNRVDLIDLANLGKYYGKIVSALPEAHFTDYNLDGKVSVVDLAIIGSNWEKQGDQFNGI